jgi:hypothetical protein
VRFPVRTQVSRPSGEVFDKLSDCRNEEKWNSQVSRAELVSAEPVGLGTQFRTINRGKAYTATVVTYEKPNLLGFSVAGDSMDIEATYRLGQADGAVVVDGELEMKPKGFLKVVLPLTKRMIQKDLDLQYESFKAFCESS